MCPICAKEFVDSNLNLVVMEKKYQIFTRLAQISYIYKIVFF